jgi:hypothetical protein
VSSCATARVLEFLNVVLIAVAESQTDWGSCVSVLGLQKV